MKSIAIIQARMGSSRLPGKVLTDLGGRPVLDWVVEAARAIPGIDGVAVATSEAPGDDDLVAWCAAKGVACHRGPEDDVLERFVQAARAEQADTVIRLTADCPLLDPEVCGLVLTLLERSGAAYACNFEPRSWPDGLDCEAFTMALLQEAADQARTPFQREHVTPYMRANRYRFPIAQATCPIPGVADERWTLDGPEDLDFLRAVVSKLGDTSKPPSWLQVLAITDGDLGLRRATVAAQKTQAMPSPEATKGGRSFEASRKLLERSQAVIPLGSQTFSKSHIQYPEAAPMFLAGGDGARVWDVDGNEYIDLVSGLLPVVLGYRDPDVDQAIGEQLRSGISFSLSTHLEIELAERLVDLIPAAEMVRFGKNGTDATSAAVRLARAFTGRDQVAVCGYHGWQDWYIGATVRNKGVPKAVSALTHTFPYNDLAALEELLGRHPGAFAAVIMEPVNIADPDQDYLQGVKDLAHAHGALLVFDEIITGFRVSLGGAQAHYNVTPDLACFGKAMGNGMPISAVTGRADVMREMEEVFFSGTFGGEALSLAAAIATIDKMRRLPIIEKLWQAGDTLVTGAEKRIAAHSLTDCISFGGLPPWKVLAFRDHAQASKDAVKTLFIREMLQNGVLINSSHNVTASLDKDEIQTVLNAYDETLKVIAAELDQGDLDRRLGNDIIRPIFSLRATS